MRTLTLLFAVAACADEVSIGRNVCGNFVLEDNEECDRPGDLCTADCRIVCAPDAPAVCETVDGQLALDQKCCPQDFACGADGACRAPSGTFSQSGDSVPFIVAPFGEYRLGDVDGDRIADALGVTSGNVITRYGAFEDPLSRSEQRAVPFAVGTVAIGDFSGDGRPDVLIPTSGGVAALESRSGTPEPLAVPVAFAAEVVGLRVAALELPTNQTTISQLHATASGVVITFNVLESEDSDSRKPCGEDVAPARVAGKRLHPSLDPGGRLAVPLAIAPEGAGPPELCIEFFNRDVGQLSAPIQVPNKTYQLIPDAETFFANLDSSSACPELVIPVHDTNTGDDLNLVLPGQDSPGGCTVVPNFNTTIGTGAALAAIRLGEPPQTRVGLVTREGLFELGNPEPVTPPTRFWTHVAVGDVNNDGREDFATISGVDDVEVFEQEPPVPNLPRVDWRVSRIPTTGLLVDVVAGDFDGDDLDDIAFTSANLDLGTTQVRVAFRDGTQFEPATSMAAIGEHQQLAVAKLPDPSLIESGFDQFDDLIVSHGGGIEEGDVASVTLLFGSANRQMIAPWFPTPLVDDDRQVRLAVSAAVGPFGTDERPGVLAGFLRFPNETCSDRRVLVNAEVLDPGVPELIGRVEGREDASVCQAVEGVPTMLAIEGAVFAPIGDGAVLALSRFGAIPADQCGALIRPGAVPIPLTCDGLIDPALSDDGFLATALKFVIRVERLGERDFVLSGVIPGQTPDGDLLVVLQLTLEVDAGSVRITRAIDLGSQTATKLGATLPVICEEATIAELGTRQDGDAVFGAGPEIVMSCRHLETGEIHVIARFAGADDAEGVVEELGTLPLVVYSDLEAGDINGDGLTDIVAVSISGTAHALLQCDSRGGCP